MRTVGRSNSMRLRRWFQYQLATLLLTITLVAVLLFAWMRFVTPNVAGFHLEGGQLVLHLSDELGRQLLPDDPNFNTVANDPYTFHVTFVSFPLYMIALAIIVIVAMTVGIYFGLRVLVGRPTRHGRRAESPSA